MLYKAAQVKKQFTLIIFCIIYYSVSLAQNYRCFQPEVVHYFTNCNGYIRGIRVDSSKTVGADSIYFLFKSNRITSGGLAWNISRSGCWLGDSVILQPDGTTLIPNYWGDTVVIKSQSPLNASWVFLRDSSHIHYLARVTTLDTMTFQQTLDSVKTITISAYIDSNSDTNALENGFQLKISKNHGFVSAFDLFMFPYRKVTGYDFYYRAPFAGNFTAPPSFTAVENFTVTDFTNPRKMDIYDFEPNDSFETKMYSVPSLYLCEPYIIQGIKTTTCLAKIMIDSLHVQYYLRERIIDTVDGSVIESDVTDTVIYDSTRIFLPFAFPEENLGVYYVTKNDPNCVAGDIYSYGPFPYGDGPDELHYKTGFGKTYGQHAVMCGTGFESYVANNNVEAQTFAYKSAHTCGTYQPFILGVPSLVQKFEISISPNPASEKMTVKTDNTGIRDIQLFNSIGQKIIGMNGFNRPVIESDISSLKNGIYIVVLTLSNGERVVDKLIVAR